MCFRHVPSHEPKVECGIINWLGHGWLMLR
jgi:hypothetical protein